MNKPTGGARSYAKGARAELLVRDRLREAGFLVIRNHGSRGEYDLLAFRKGTIWLVEVKGWSATISPREREALLELARDVEGTGIACEPVYVHYINATYGWAIVAEDGKGGTTLQPFAL